jgi:hypothetical protein
LIFTAAEASEALVLVTEAAAADEFDTGKNVMDG